MAWSEIIGLVTALFTTVIAAYHIWIDLNTKIIFKDNAKSRQSFGTHSIVTVLFGLVASSQEESESIIGDLLEEFNEFPSRLNAYLWLYKQVLKSALPLAYKKLKHRLASYFGERVR